MSLMPLAQPFDATCVFYPHNSPPDRLPCRVVGVRPNPTTTALELVALVRGKDGSVRVEAVDEAVPVNSPAPA